MDASSVSGNLLPMGECFGWQSDILWVGVVSEGMIVLGCLGLIFALWGLLQELDQVYTAKEVWVLPIYLLLGAVYHLVSIFNNWMPIYQLSEILKGLVAAVSIVTAALMFPLASRMREIVKERRLQEDGKTSDRTQSA